MREILTKLCARQDLTGDEAKESMAAIMDGQMTPAQVAAFLIALKMKGETAEEIYGCASAMRERVIQVKTAGSGELTDTCGTGGDGRGTFNISTAAALIAAGAGLKVAKHGNRSISSKCGSADVLEALGVKLDLTAAHLGACLDEVGIAFLYAPLLHQAMKHAAAPRRELGIRSVFNVLGPLTNPAKAQHQVLGVYAPELAGVIASVLSLLGSRRALVVHGEDGSDELTLAGKTLVFEVNNGCISQYTIKPEDVGFSQVPAEALTGGNPAFNAAILMAVLQGEKNPYRDVSVLNAGAALYVGGLADNLQNGVRLAEQAVDQGAALAKLDALRQFTGGKGYAFADCS